MQSIILLNKFTGFIFGGVARVSLGTHLGCWGISSGTYLATRLGDVLGMGTAGNRTLVRAYAYMYVRMCICLRVSACL